MGKRDDIEPAGPQNEKAKKAQQERHEQRQRDIEPAGPQNEKAKKAQQERHEQRQRDIDQNQRDDPEDQR